MKITRYIKEIINELSEDEDVEYGPGSDSIVQIPTLEPQFYRPISPMLKERFKLVSYFLESTHGDWLSCKEMENLWSERIESERLQGIKTNLQAHLSAWDNNAGSVFSKHRLTLFAGSAYSNEHIYLLWLDHQEEPQVWVYDINGEARYCHLEAYLKAYLDDDLSAYERESWLTI